MSLNETIHRLIYINAPVSDVWDALTNPARIKQWLLDTEVDVVSGRKEVSPVIFSGTVNGKAFTDKGTILKFEKDKVFRYNYHSGVSNMPGIPDACIEFTLKEEGHITRLQLKCTEITTEAIYHHLNFYWNTTPGILKAMIEKGV
jgi:uncharacterized protein YndB with AHSA1/START domain